MLALIIIASRKKINYFVRIIFLQIKQISSYCAGINFAKLVKNAKFAKTFPTKMSYLLPLKVKQRFVANALNVGSRLYFLTGIFFNTENYIL